MLIVFAAAIFLSALLLFLVQPLVGRMVLPVLGGTPSVWNTCMVFFQVLLLAGYLYAHLLTRYLKPGIQAVVHGVVVLTPLLVLPIALRTDLSVPTTEFPILWLLTTLAGLSALPFLVLSTSGPLLQRWFSATDHRLAHDPYFLYAASNTGSLLALLGYPVLAEPLLRLQQQSTAWAWGYGVLAGLVLCCAVLRVVRAAPMKAAPEIAVDQPGGVLADAPIRWRSRLVWVALAAAPSSLMIGVTTYISTDLAPVPLLWIVPLSIYLLTMIVAYSRFGGAATRWATAALPPVLLALVVLMLLGPSWFPSLKLPLHLLVFAVGAMACHGRLAVLRPDPRHLTEYFLLVSLGGALGGAFNGIVAPLVFNRVLEYPIAMILTCGTALATAGKRAPNPAATPAWWRGLFPPPTWLVSIMLGGLLLAVSITATAFGGAPNWPTLLLKLIVPAACAAGLIVAGWSERAETDSWRRAVLTIAAPLSVASLYLSVEFLNGVLDLSGRRLGLAVQIGLTALACAAFAPWAWRFTWAVGILLMFEVFSRAGASQVLLTERSFFGVHRVQEKPGAIELMHGTTSHGIQLRAEGKEQTPTAYYHPTGPAGEVFGRLNSVGRVRTVGLIGLGSGVLAAYSKAGQTFTFFEIDPVVVRVAKDPRYFTFLSAAKGLVRCEVGDGRLLMSRSEDLYDVIVVDAFSSDSIPLHLMTVEAMKMYADHLRPRGVILMHTSNRHLRLAGVVAGNAVQLGLSVRRKLDVPTEEQLTDAKAPSEWLVIARDKDDLGFLDSSQDWEGPEQIAEWTKLRVWTDDFSNILGVYASP